MAYGYKYIILKSSLGDDSFLDVEGGSKHPWTKITTWKKNSDDNQIWYHDVNNQTLRTKLNNFCVEWSPERNMVVTNEYKGTPHQKWIFEPPFIKSVVNPSAVLTIQDNNKNKGAYITVISNSNQPGQQWHVEEVGGSAPIPSGFTGNFSSSGTTAFTAAGTNIGQIPSYGGNIATGEPAGGISIPTLDMDKKTFLIASVMGDYVLDVKGDDKLQGALVIMYKPHRNQNQLWYLDNKGFIRSSINDFVFYADKKGESLRMFPYTDDPKKQWRIDGNKIVNGEGLVLDIRGGKCGKNEELCSYDYKKQENQHWTIRY